MCEANTPKTSVYAPFVKLYKILLRFALEPLFSEIAKTKGFFPAGFWTNYNFPWLLDQLVQRVESKKNATRILQGLDSTHEKCYY